MIVSNFEKATQLVSALHVNLQDVDKGPQLLLKICEVLQQHQIPVLDTIIAKIVEQLGKLLTLN